MVRTTSSEIVPAVVRGVPSERPSKGKQKNKRKKKVAGTEISQRSGL
jgi:hypothetical protein